MIAIINTGGTFNKVYDPIRGELTIPRNDDAPRRALESMRGLSFEIDGLIYKDSLDMDDADRLQLCRHIQSSKSSRIVVIHGTDTMHLSAAALKEYPIAGKSVVFTGSMYPFSIDPIEATANLSFAVCALEYIPEGVYIAMHGLVLPCTEIRKNRELGLFERVKEERV